MQAVIHPLLLIAGFVGIASRTKKTPTIAFDKSITKEEIALKLNWIDVENHLREAEIALQQNDSNKLISALENAISTGLRVATNENSTSISSRELLNLLKTKMQDDVLSNQLKEILEKCQNARYGWGLSQEELTELIPNMKPILAKLKTWVPGHE